MRRIWFTIFIAVSLACSAAASAWAAQACPYKAMRAASHECCPQPPAAPGDKSDHSKKMDCKLGQACRAAPAVAPLVPMVATALVTAMEQPALLKQAKAPPFVLTGLWRPPRTT